MMDVKKIRSLIELMEEKELVNLELSDGDKKISLTRHYDTPTTPTITTNSHQTNQANPQTTQNDLKLGSVETSPMVGVFYVAPSPNDPPFVKVGQKVQAGDTLGIIEAMKIMNPLEATQSGIIDEILINNAEVVQFGQPVIRYKA